VRLIEWWVHVFGLSYEGTTRLVYMVLGYFTHIKGSNTSERL